MSQSNFLSSSNPPPNASEIPILTELKECYLMWHNCFNQLPRLTRYTLGAKIDNSFIELLEKMLEAQYTKRENKFVVLNKLSNKLDALKFFLTLLWQAKGITANKYTQLSEKLVRAGKMLGKWLALFQKVTPPAEIEGE